MHHRLPVAAALTTSFYAAPQVPEDARRLWDAACESARYHAPLQLPIRAGRGLGSTLLLSREWGVADLEARLVEAAEASYEPSWDRQRGEFTWGMGLDEEFPRGQFNAFMAAAEAAGPGAWARLSEAPLERCPQVVGVDFPRIALSRAEWIDGRLHLRLAPLFDTAIERTSFSVVGVEPDDSWQALGPTGVSIESHGTVLTVSAPLVAADVEISRSR